MRRRVSERERERTHLTTTLLTDLKISHSITTFGSPTLIRMPLPIEALSQVVITRLQLCQEEIRRLKLRLKRRRKELIRLRDLEVRFDQLHEDYGFLENEIIGLRSILDDNDIPYAVGHLV